MSAKQKALSIIKQLRSEGYKGYLCGGCVRDLLLKQKPKDYDIVTDATPDQIKKVFSRTVSVGAQFGVMQVLLGKESFEVATFRRDGRYEDGRRPEQVDFCDEQEDALRRDFTINGLFFDPEKEKIIDYVGGEKDIENKLIRTIGTAAERFNEDHLRLLRVIRFACRFGFAIEEKTWKSTVEMAPKIKQISRERIRDEIFKMMTGADPTRAIQLLEKSKLLFHIFSSWELVSCENCLSALEKGKPFEHPELPFTVMLTEIIPKKMTQKTIDEICCELKLSKKVQQKIEMIILMQDKVDQSIGMTISELKRFLRNSFIDEILYYYSLQMENGRGDREKYLFCRNKLQEYQENLWPQPVMTGNDLKKMGIKPGPVFKQILTLIEDRQLEGNIGTSEEAKAFVQKEFANLSESTERNIS